MRAYYYEAAGKQVGPVSADELRIHGVQGNTLVWNEDMPTWAPAASVPELAAFFQPMPPPLPAHAARNAVALAIDQPVPPFAAGQGHTLPPSQVPSTPVTVPRPQFSAETSRYRWWHYIVLAIAVIILMLLGRACGTVLEHTISTRNQVLQTGDLTLIASASAFKAVGLL